MTKDEYWYWICNIKDIYRNQIKLLLDQFHDPEEVYKASEDELIRSGAVREKEARMITASKNNFRGLYKLDKMRNEGISFIYYGSTNYPIQLLCLEDKPFSLYVKGGLPDPDLPAAGIVGARTCSGYGKEMALRYAQTLAAASVQIISGMAVGIDSYASRGAMEAGGKTFVVLGSGLDVIYPPENIELYYQIVLNRGGIISEYPMGTAPVGWQFPFRNRLISAFSDKLLIIEARKRSGTLSTASHALTQGKDIYALPGRVTDPLSEGCNRLIADGAGVLLDPALILEEFYAMPGFNRERPETAEPDAYSRIFSALSYEPKTIDRIVALSCTQQSEAIKILTEMEIEGICCQPSKDCYARI